MDPSSTLAGWNSDSYGNKGLFDQWCFSFSSKDDGLSEKKKNNNKCYMTEEELVVMGPVPLSHSPSKWSGPNLLQNCDLPPPVKVFAGTDKNVLNSIRPKHISKVSQEVEDRELSSTKIPNESEKLELMKALQLSQSRARTAERKATVMAEERDNLSSLLLSESLRFFAHRQWVKLLQLEVSQLKSQKLKKQESSCSSYNSRIERDKGSSEAEDGENVGSLPWCMTLALCLGIAGVGYAVGSRYFF
ncbi:hypothetical protein IFM89_023697 [Coptis chinensis]|uniref:Uncharacterized protein n=1 Tax=Coptis chinensis TaxID=261450 RepID=A0A835I5Q9_9MAGN|nr:hypothetical protein IFM89_023697 [Coptis chinensis]